MAWSPLLPILKIAYLWNMAKRSVCTQNSAPASIQDLWAADEMAWFNVCRHLLTSELQHFGRLKDLYPMTF